MDDRQRTDEAVETLKEMGLKEYEAKCFVALTRLPEGTAKRISEASEVPRTRVYDAVRVLESKGLVEVQHTDPKVFRAVPVGEAVDSLLDRFESRTEELEVSLRNLQPVSPETEASHEVWALSGERAVSNRTYQLINEAEDEAALVVRSGALDDGEFIGHLRSALDRGVDVVLGTPEREASDEISERLPGADVFVSGLGWLSSETYPDDDTEISSIVLVDRETMLVSSFGTEEGSGHTDAHAVFGHGFDNGLVAVVRRLISTRLLDEDP